MSDEPTKRRKPRRITNPAVDQTSPAFRIMEKVGGCSAFAALIGRHVQTCYRWLVKGYIPGEEQSHVIICFRDAGIELDPAEFVRVPEAA